MRKFQSGNPLVMALLEHYIFVLLSCNSDFFLQFASVSISLFPLSSTYMTHFLLFNLSIKVSLELMEVNSRVFSLKALINNKTFGKGFFSCCKLPPKNKGPLFSALTFI